MADPGEGSGTSVPPLLFLHQTEARKAEKKIFGDWAIPLSKGMDDRAPPPRSGGLDPPVIEVPHERITRCNAHPLAG